MDRNSKKRKLNHDTNTTAVSSSTSTFKPSARFQARPGGRTWTVSIAIPGSIISDCATADQRIVLPGRIARALAVFSIDEVIIYDDAPRASGSGDSSMTSLQDAKSGYTGEADPCHFLAHVLSYLETPPFMRRTLFPLHPNLRLAGLLPSLDMPHHPHVAEWLPYREGVTIASPGKGSAARDGEKGTLVDVGLKHHVRVDDKIPGSTRLTLRMPDDENGNSGADAVPTAEAIHPKEPRDDGGYYWGFDIRRCRGLSAVVTESPHEGGYDVGIGTSERGQPARREFPANKDTLEFEHLLIVFGGPRGLEYAAMNDPDLADKGITGGKTRELFDHWVNVLPGQGSRTIRTDEAVFIALTELRRLWESA